MKNKKVILLYLVLIIYAIFTNLFISNNYNLYTNIINPLFWILSFTACLIINKGLHERVKFKTIKLQTLFIIITIYLILYFLSGLFIGYSKNIYDVSILGIIKNIWAYIIPIFFIEYIRCLLVEENNSYKNYIIIILIFTLINLNIKYVLGLNVEELFKYSSSNIIPLIAEEIILIYISKKCGYLSNLFYLIPLKLVKIVLPFLPSYDWYYTAVTSSLLPLIVFIFLKRVNDRIDTNISRRELKKIKTYKIILVLIPIALLILFVIGAFKYKPTVILSNSMKPVFSRGDIVVIEQLNKNKKKNIAKYDIIEYIIDGSIVAHRVINIENHYDGTRLYTTMGDNNNAPDTKKVKEEQIIGKVKFSIPIIGYPSVYLNELFNKNKKSVVETGKD